MPSMPVLVIGLDAHWRARMQRLLAARGELEWLGAYAPAQRRPCNSGAPSLLLLDGDDPRIERERRRPLLPAPHRLYFYRQPTVATLVHCINCKANACLDKLARPEAVLRAIRAAESGLFVTIPALLLQALRGVEDVPAELTSSGVWSALTGRQREIVGWAAQGMSNKQIARQLNISPETVKTHLHHIFQRGGVHGRMALMAARRDGASSEALPTDSRSPDDRPE
jgi:DNA-binding NarL/FixJ family response regulator